jgi:hypothetical protein
VVPCFDLRRRSAHQSRPIDADAIAGSRRGGERRREGDLAGPKKLSLFSASA